MPDTSSPLNPDMNQFVSILVKEILYAPDSLTVIRTEFKGVTGLTTGGAADLIAPFFFGAHEPALRTRRSASFTTVVCAPPKSVRPRTPAAGCTDRNCVRCELCITPTFGRRAPGAKLRDNARFMA